MPIFEYDDQKSRSNKEKHGLDFEDAQALWDDPDALEVPILSHDERRFRFIARLPRDPRLWTAIITYRENRTRIISVRRARPKERAAYRQRRGSAQDD